MILKGHLTINFGIHMLTATKRYLCRHRQFSRPEAFDVRKAGNGHEKNALGHGKNTKNTKTEKRDEFSRRNQSETA